MCLFAKFSNWSAYGSTFKTQQVIVHAQRDTQYSSGTD